MQNGNVEEARSLRKRNDLYVDSTFLALALLVAGVSLAIGAPRAMKVLRDGTSEYVTWLDVVLHGGVLLVAVLLPAVALCVLILRVVLRPVGTWNSTINLATRVVGVLAGLSVVATLLLS